MKRRIEMADLFQKGFIYLKRNWSFILSVTSIFVIVLTVYGKDLLVLMSEAAQSEVLSYAILVPFLACFLIYRKKEFIKASIGVDRSSKKIEKIPLSEIAGVALCISAFLLYWYGSYTFYPLEYHMASLVVFVIGLTQTLFGSRILAALIFPIMFLIFLIPPPFAITYAVGAALGNFSTQGSYGLLKIVGVPVTLSSEYGPPTMVINSSARGLVQFGVDLPCSGIYSLLAFVMFAAFLAYIVRGSAVRKMALFPLGFLLLQILNVLRISLIILIAYRVGEEIAMTIFHTFSGWLLIFSGMLLLLLISERLLHLRIFRATSRVEPCPRCDTVSKAAEPFCLDCGKFFEKHAIRLPKKFWIMSTALLIACYLVTLSVQAPTFAVAQGLTITNPNPEASPNIFPKVPDYEVKFLYRDQDFEKIAHQDASLLYAYVSQNISEPTVYVLVAVADSVTNLHSWEACLFTMQSSQGYSRLVTVFDSNDVQILQNPPIIARYFAFKQPSNYTQVTLYWYQQAMFRTGLTVASKFTRISLIMLTTDQTSLSILEQRLLSLSQSIVAYWEPLRAQSLVSLGIPTMQASLVTLVFLAIIVQTGQRAREWRRKTINLKIFEKLASPEEKSLYRTINELRQETCQTTTRTIASALRKTTGKLIKTDRLVQMLNNLREYKIISADVIAIEDKPVFVWKP